MCFYRDKGVEVVCFDVWVIEKNHQFYDILVFYVAEGGWFQLLKENTIELQMLMEILA